MRHVELAAILVSLVAFTPGGYSQDTPSNEQLEVASMIESHLNIVASIRSFDVLIEGTTLVTIGGTPSHEIISRTRWIRRGEGNEQLYVRSAEMHPLVEVTVDNRTGEREFGLSVSVALLRDGIYTSRLFPGPSSAMGIGENSFESSSTAPEFRLLGMEKYPPYAPSRPGQVDSLITFLKQPHSGYALVESNEERVLIKHAIDKLDEGGGKYVRWWEYDPNNLVFTKIRYHHWDVTKEKLIPKYVETLEWSKVGDVVVPRTISGEHQQDVLDNPIDRNIVVQHKQYDFSFRWNSVNSEIDEAVISRDAVLNMNTAKQLTDPKSFKDKAKKLRSMKRSVLR